jgi:tRNA U34 5-methylaminomethyl-2-thiouridine-forming methyltransferase MnmC
MIMNTDSNTQIILTKDGSTTLYNKHFNATYHSKFGAVEESKHVFINQGLQPVLSSGNSEISILEIGFGTGLNALLTYIETKNNNISINYHAVELFPISLSTVKELKFNHIESESGLFFEKIHALEFGILKKLSPSFNLIKYNEEIENFSKNINVDIIYFDAFSPREQPELWTEDVFNNMYCMLKVGGRLVTYCAQGQMKRNMRSAGFTVKALPGYGNKREMTLAEKLG